MLIIRQEKLRQEKQKLNQRQEKLRQEKQKLKQRQEKKLENN